MKRLIFLIGPVAVCAAACSTASNDSSTNSTPSAILGGAKDDTHTAVVAVFRKEEGASSSMFCSGALIAPNLVLTGAHCVADLVVDGPGGGTQCTDTADRKSDKIGAAADAKRFVVVNGTDAYDANATTYGVVRVLLPTGNGPVPICGNDVAMLVLSNPIDGAVPYAPRLDGPPAAGDHFSAIGYGYDGAVNTDGTRRSRDGLLVSSVGVTARATANDWIASEGPCGGDSGSPALDEQGRIIGVMSRGVPTLCKSMLYTRVDPFAEWMKSAAVDAAKSGGYPTPTWARSAVDAGTTDSGAPAKPQVAPDSTSSCATSPGGTSSGGGIVMMLLAGAIVASRRRSRGERR